MRISEHKNKNPSFIRGIRSSIRQIRIGVFGHSGRTRGFTLLFAVLVGSLLFSIGIAIANLALKEIALSSAGKQSEKAFYAADTGTECALYWDRRVGGTFPNSETAPRRSVITCNKTDLRLTVAAQSASEATTKFLISFSPSCADVTVVKTRVGSTVIESRGRNDCGTGDNPARVERALRVRY